MIDIEEIIRNNPELVQLANELGDIYRERLDKVVSPNSPLKNFRLIIEYKNQDFEIQIQTEAYFKYMENGRRPGKMPPVAAIEQWLQVKKIVPYANSRGKIPSMKQLAFAISKKIGERGIQGKHVFEQSVNSAPARKIIQEISNRIAYLTSGKLVNSIWTMIDEEIGKKNNI